MKLQEIAEKKLISKDGHFMPLIFVDMSIPSVYVGAAATYAGRQISANMNDNKKNKFSPIPILAYEFPKIKMQKGAIDVLTDSINDINY